MCMWYMYTCVCWYDSCVQGGQGTLGILLLHAPPSSTDTGSLTETEQSWWPEILSAHHGTRLQTCMAMPSSYMDSVIQTPVLLFNAANALTHWTISPDSLPPFYPRPDEPTDTCPFLLGARGYSSSQPCAHTGTAARPAHPVWEHRGSDN